LDRLLRLALAIALSVMVSACADDDLPARRSLANAAWTEVHNQYRQRLEIVARIIAAFEAKAPGEREVVAALRAGEARLRRLQVDDETITDNARFREFVEAQRQFSAAIRQLLETIERYPELTDDGSFAALLHEFANNEDRVVIARRDFIAAGRAYNREFEELPDRWVNSLLHPGAKPIDVLTGARLDRAHRS
jgi:LemA protein